MLHNHHIVITRPIEQAHTLAEALKTRGAIPVFYPGFTFGPPEKPEELDAALRDAAQGQYDAIILTSGQAARVISERLNALNLSWAEQTVWVVGPHTAAACQFEAKIQVPERPMPPVEDHSYDAYALARSMKDVHGKRILLPQSPLAADSLKDDLGSVGADVTVVHPYSVIAAQGGDDLPDFLRRGLISAFTFFSGSAVEGTMARLEVAGLSIDDVKSIPAVCFGKITSSRGRALGLDVWEGDTTYHTFYRLLEHACAGDKRFP